MLDAPVTGSSPRAEDGSLTIMAGGERRDFERALPALEAMGELIVHVGELGQGEMLKLINNALAAANASALAEALVLARAERASRSTLYRRCVSAGSGASTQLDAEGGPMPGHDFTRCSRPRTCSRTCGSVSRRPKRAGVPFPAAAHARDLLTATGRGYGDQDYRAIIEAAEGLADTAVVTPRHMPSGPKSPKKTFDLQGIWDFGAGFGMFNASVVRPPLRGRAPYGARLHG